MIPEHIIGAAGRGEIETIRAYFDDDREGARNVNDTFGELSENDSCMTLLLMCADGGDSDHLTLAHVNLARYLLSRGASTDVRNVCGNTALTKACYCGGGAVAVSEMVELLLSKGADPNARNSYGRTPLGAYIRFAHSPRLAVVTALLRYGASLDRCFRDDPLESLLDITVRTGPATTSAYSSVELPAISALVSGVRRNGSFKRYGREPHREFLALRGLAMRGHLAPMGTRRTRGAQKWKAAVAFLARHGDNGVVWNVLSFWRATE